jgi:hypothetical protein
VIEDRFSGGIVAGFFSFTELTDLRAHTVYNEWHQLDHMPEQMPLPGIAHGERWVLSPRCRAELFAADDHLARTHYLTLYSMTAPIDAALESFYERADELHREGRFFDRRRAIAAGPLDVREKRVSPRLPLTADALPYRPNRGVYVIAQRPVGASGSRADRPALRIDALLAIPGVAGVWSFGPFADLEETEAAGFGEARRDAGKPLAAEGRLEADVVVCYLDEDPVAVSTAIADVLASGRHGQGIGLSFAGPLERVVPWEWDWFEES